MRLITIDEFDEVYNLFIQSFPKEELRPYEDMKNLFLQNAFDIYVLKENDTLEGAMSVWVLDKEFVYIENFAINRLKRGSGLGSLMLEQIKKQFLRQAVILEVEQPKDELTKRRIIFYERNQFILNPYHYIQPSFYKQALPVDLMLMSYPNSIPSQYDFNSIKKQIFRIVYNQTV